MRESHYWLEVNPTCTKVQLGSLWLRGGWKFGLSVGKFEHKPLWLGVFARLCKREWLDLDSVPVRTIKKIERFLAKDELSGLFKLAYRTLKEPEVPPRRQVGLVGD